MANGQTANYGLNQWIPEDLFLREEFNNDNSKIDEALAGLQGQITSLDGEMGTVQGDLQGKINTTNSNLTTAKNNLQSQITALDKELGTVQSDLEGQIDTAESTAASNLATAKNDLQSKINTVSSNLTTAKNDLQTKINTTNTNLTTTNSNLTKAKNNLQSQITALQNEVDYVTGQYTGNGTSGHTIELEITAQFGLVYCQTKDYCYEQLTITPLGGLYVSEYGRNPLFYETLCFSGTTLKLNQNYYMNQTGRSYFYIAFK